MMTRQRRASAEEWNALIAKAERGRHPSVARALRGGYSVVVDHDGTEILPPEGMRAAAEGAPPGEVTNDLLERYRIEARVNAAGSRARN